MALLVMQQLFYNFQPKTVITVHLSSTTTAAKARHHRVHNLLSSPEHNGKMHSGRLWSFGIRRMRGACPNCAVALVWRIPKNVFV